MDNTYSKLLIGNGPAFPLVSTSGGLDYRDDIARINQSLFIIFETHKGDRIMMPEFGSDLHKYRFDPLDRVLLEKIRYTITEDIRRWEPRISTTSIEFLEDTQAIENNILYVSINYTLINTDVAANYVYPYKLNSYDTSSISY